MTDLIKEGIPASPESGNPDQNPAGSVVATPIPQSKGNATGKDRLQVLDALRGFAAISVAIVHFTVGMEPTWFREICHWGWLGVDVFFVISGYIIPYALEMGSYQFPTDFPRYLAKRITRLHPPYTATVIILMILKCLSISGCPSNALGIFTSHLLLVSGIAGVPWLNNVFWSLAIEMQFYLLIGVLPFHLPGKGIRSIIILGAFLLLSLLPISGVWLLPHLPLFTFGILTFLKTTHKIKSSWFIVGIILSAMACALSMGKPQAMVGALTAILICVVKCPIPQPFLKLGVISYSLYLLHPVIKDPLISILGEHSGSVLNQMIVVAICIGISIGIAWIWYRLIEYPFKALSSSIRYKMRQP
ncbi:MAG: acyltransferase [Luteolibacter sp.]